MKSPTGSPLPPIDVELILEGSYPYITGGVSSWTHSLVEAMPDISFGITHIAARKEDARQIKYKLPANIKFVQNIYLYDYIFLKEKGRLSFEDRKLIFGSLNKFHQREQAFALSSYASMIRKLIEKPFLKRIFHSREAFSLILSLYKKHAPRTSFLDFFWIWRFMHLPLVQLLQARLPETAICHTISTGFAGFFGCLHKLNAGTPLILTEHGIYTKERNIEIAQADWVPREAHPEHLIRADQGAFKRLWLDFFHTLGLWTYQLSDQITTLYEGNRALQIAFGAKPDKCMIIPNGIDLARFCNLRPAHSPDPDALRVGFIGRVVPIKDVKTFLQAAKIVSLSCPKASFHIIGPFEEDPDYMEQIKEMVEILNLNSKMIFYGRQNVLEHYPKLDIIVLTSLSEGQPMVLLEAMAAGIPCVATDVGSCRELLEGVEGEDKDRGACGIVTSLRSPSQTAAAILSICRNPKLFADMAANGKKRVHTFYEEKTIIRRYRDLYEKFLNPKKAKTPGKA